MNNGGHVELAPHLAAETLYFTAQVGEILAQGVDAAHGGLPEVAKFALDLADIPIRSASKYPGSGGVLFAAPYASLEFSHLVFEGTDPWFQLPASHSRHFTGAEVCAVGLIHTLQ